MEINSITEPSVEEETKIEGIADSLYRRIAKETEKYLRLQLQILGVDFKEIKDVKSNLKKIVYPESFKALAAYEYKGVKILGLQISANNLAIEFDIPDLKTLKQNSKENQNV